MTRIILASGSEIRAELLSNAGLEFTIEKARVDESTVLSSLKAEGASSRDIADALAEIKARKVSSKSPGAYVIGCDQVLEFNRSILSKPRDQAEAVTQLRHMSGQHHALLSAAVIYLDGEPQWRHVGKATLFMHELSDAYITAYVDRNWDQIQHCVGGYQLEAEGARLFSRIQGDYFTILGIPLLDVLSYLALRGIVER